MSLSIRLCSLAAAAALLCVGVAAAQEPGKTHADASGDPAAVTEKGGMWYDKGGVPTYKIEKDGKVDWNTFSGYIRYTANCMQCHGPDGLGSSYGPVLVNSLQHLTYNQVIATIAGGKKDVSASSDLVMPTFGGNRNVMCYVNQIFIYLRARSDGALGRGRPDNHGPKPEAIAKDEDACMG